MLVFLLFAIDVQKLTIFVTMNLVNCVRIFTCFGVNRNVIREKVLWRVNHLLIQWKYFWQRRC